MLSVEMIWCLIIALFVTILAFIILTCYVIIINNRHYKELERISIYQIHTGAKIDDTIPEILDLIINESFKDYQAKTLLPLEENYINEERESEIRKALVSLVTSRISAATMDKLSLFYNANNLADILADKIYITVMDYVIDHNTHITDQEN